jgi:hypothetical protein
LVLAAIQFGLSPNTAVFAIKGVLGLPDGVNLQTYDAYTTLQTAPSDPTALAVEKIAVEVAILTSLSDDDMGTNLTLKVLDAAANNQTLDLADANDLANILGIDITGIANPNDYPQPLREIFDRDQNIAQAAVVNDIEAEWQDFLTLQDNVNSTSIADLNIHVNQDPIGFATATLVDGLVNAPYNVVSTDLVQGFSDPENASLSVSTLNADKGAVSDNGDGSFTITPDANYAGPVELTYAVIDGQGGSTTASQLFVLAPTVPCFASGTRIETETGMAAVEDLRVGQRVVTGDGRLEPIIWIGSRQVNCRQHPKPVTVWPVRVNRGAFARHVPDRDLWLSPQHAVFLDGVLIPIKHLINSSTIAQVAVDMVTYYHVELRQHDLLLAEGLPAESYLDTDDHADLAGGDVVRLHPDFSTISTEMIGIWEARGYAPLVVTGAKLDAARKMLAERTCLMEFDERTSEPAVPARCRA